MTSVFSFPLAVVTFCVLAVLSSFQVGNAQLVYNSLGCFFDSSASRILPNSGPQNLQTLQSCGAQAVLNFVQYFGLEFGGQCFYGGSILRQVSASNCNMTCIADPKQNCGGANAISIYQVTPPPATVAYTSYLGCLTDYSSRILSQQGPQNDATVQSCAALAVARAVPYFGLEFGGECWYGSSILRNVSSSACLLACTENPNQRCGGAYAIDVYQVNPAVAVVPYSSYVGCLPAGALPSSGAQSAGTAQACAILAASKGANFFGLGNGGQCSFGSSLRTNVSGAVCNLACTASPSERCGGSLAIDVWALSLTAKQ